MQDQEMSQDVTTDNNTIDGVSIKTSFDQATGGAGDAEPSTGGFLDSLPEAMRSEKAFQNVKSVEDLANQFLNTQKLIGKKTVGIPNEESSDEEVEKFYSALRPEKAEAYEFSELEGRDEEVAGKVKDIFHEAGLSQKQAKIVQEKYDALMSELNPQLSEEQLNADFEKRGQELLGDNYQEVMDNATKFAGDLVPSSVSEIINKMDNDSMLAVASLVDSIQKKYMKEDNTVKGGNPHGGDDRVQRRRDLMKNPAFSNKLHPDHDKVYGEWKSLY